MVINSRDNRTRLSWRHAVDNQLPNCISMRNEISLYRRFLFASFFMLLVIKEKEVFRAISPRF